MSRKKSLQPGPHVHVPYEQIGKYLRFLKKRRLNLEIYFGSRTLEKITERELENLQKKLDYNPAVSIHAPFMDLSPGAVDPEIREITEKRFSATLDIAGMLKPKAVTFHSGYDRWKYDNRVDIWLEGSVRTWKPLSRRALDMGIDIAIENIFEEDPEHLRLLSREISMKNFGVCFDSGHFNLFSKLPLAEWLGIIKPYIKELHLHDNMRFADQHLAIGDGDFDFKTLFSEVEDIECVHTIEAHTVKDVEKSLERYEEFRV